MYTHFIWYDLQQQKGNRREREKNPLNIHSFTLITDTHQESWFYIIIDKY
jgi:hypothetical protein